MNQSEIICQRCGSINDYFEKQSGPHVSAYCNGCGNYIKHLPQSNKVLLYFGKYAGNAITDMVDKEQVSYLNWLYNQPFLNERIRNAIKKHLSI